MTPDSEPLDLAEVEDRRHSQYITKRDMAIAAALLPFFVAFLWFVFDSLRKQAEEATCTKNMKEIYSALNLYVSDNDNRYPPVCAFTPEGAPLVENGGVNSWITLVAGGMSARASFLCPSAKGAELVYSVGRLAGAEDGDPEHKGQLASAYGFYRMWELQPQSYLSDQSGEVIVSETSNLGAADTYDPHPFMASGMQQPHDGFMIGWDTGNDALAPESRSVTRLAFPNTKDGRFRSGGPSRHDNGIRALFGDGHVGFLRPNQAKIQRRGTEPFGLWGDR